MFFILRPRFARFQQLLQQRNINIMNSRKRIYFPHQHILSLNAGNRSLATASSSMAQLSREYGLLAFAVYCSLAFPTFCGCLYAITYMGVTQKDVKKMFERIKNFFGFPPSSPPPAAPSASPEKSHNWDWLPEWARSEATIDFLSNCLLAMGMTKIFAPIKIGLTAFIVPPLGRRLKAMGIIRSAIVKSK